MAAGNPQGLSDWNNRAGQLAITLRNNLVQIQQFKSELDAVTDAALLALNFSQADINTMRSAYADANDLALIFQGSASTHLTGTYDYRTFLKLLYGVS